MPVGAFFGSVRYDVIAGIALRSLSAASHAVNGFGEFNDLRFCDHFLKKLLLVEFALSLNGFGDAGAAAFAFWWDTWRIGRFTWQTIRFTWRTRRLQPIEPALQFLDQSFQAAGDVFLLPCVRLALV